MIDLLQNQLRQPSKLINIDGECELQDKMVYLPFSRQPSPDHLEHKPSDVHSHHDGKDLGAQKENHRDIHTRYEWLCDDTFFPKLSFRYFIEYPAFEKIDVEWIVNGQQGMSQLDKRKSTLDIKQ